MTFFKNTVERRLSEQLGIDPSSAKWTYIS